MFSVELEDCENDEIENLVDSKWYEFEEEPDNPSSEKGKMTICIDRNKLKKYMQDNGYSEMDIEKALQYADQREENDIFSITALMESLHSDKEDVMC